MLYHFPLTCRYPNNEHENDFANGQGFDFERVVYAGELGNEEDMENDDLPPDLLRLENKMKDEYCLIKRSQKL